MENNTIDNKSFSPQILGHVQTAANLALFMAIIVVIRLGFDIYNLLSYMWNMNSSWDKHAISYFSNSIFGSILSVISIYFLFRFYQLGTSLYRESNIQDWEGLFLHFRNYLGVAIVMIINWTIFFIVNNIFSRFSF